MRGRTTEHLVVHAQHLLHPLQLSLRGSPPHLCSFCVAGEGNVMVNLSPPLCSGQGSSKEFVLWAWGDHKAPVGFHAINTTGSSASVTAIKWKWPLVGVTADVQCPPSVLRADGGAWLGLCGSAAAQSRLSCSTQRRHSSARSCCGRFCFTSIHYS